MTGSAKTAIVTGGSRGIGAAISQRLAAEGMAVVVNYAGNAEAAAETVARIADAGGQAVAAQGDVADPKAAQALFDLAEARFGGVDVLVNNAGVMALAPVAHSDPAMVDRHIDINLKGTFNMLREAAQRLRDGGRIVNLSTTVVGAKFETYGIYAATKAAVETLSAVLAKELRGRQITVNAVAPGPTGTDLFLSGKPEAVIEKLSKAAPLERLGAPEDIANVVAFLTGPDGGWINAQVLRANGGLL